MERLGDFQTLVAVMDRLREPGGCPWDRQQTYESLRRYLLEECYEVAEALDQGDADALREELGDLLFQIVFLARLAKEEGKFRIDDVIRTVAEKLIRRHPHVFGSETAETPEQVEEHWERIKRSEKANASDERKAGGGSRLDGVPVALPAMLKARLLGERAARVGFDWKRTEDIVDQAAEELDELRAALDNGDRAEVAGELGDVLFTVVMLARRTNIDPEGALERTNRKFRKRFAWIERTLSASGTAFESASFELLDRLWKESKDAD